MIAVLPMYDWPEVRAETDLFWARLREGFRREGLSAPEHLTRDRDLRSAWSDPSLLLGQTCGLPFVQGLAVTLLGSGDYGVPGCAPGYYRSAVVVRADDPRRDLAAFRRARLALNGRDSQSGYAAILHHVAPLAEGGRFFGQGIVTGSHELSALMVAAGEADIAALDFISWRLFQAFRPASGLRVLFLTDPTPGLPFVAAAGTDPERHHRVLAEAIPRLAPGPALPRGFVPLEAGDYAILRDRFQAAEERVTV